MRSSRPAWWLTAIIPTIQEAEIRKIKVQGQPGQNISETSFQQIRCAWGAVL
jgi:hypothetical protein